MRQGLKNPFRHNLSYHRHLNVSKERQTLLRNGRPRKPLLERFWQYVDKNGSNGCWLWTGAKFSSGYGCIGSGGGRKRGGRNLHAPRLSWEIHNGMIPEGLWVLHHCDNPPCVNPSHLFLGTKIDNVSDRHMKHRDAQGDSHGTHTHPEKIRRGENHYTSKLTENSIHTIRKLRTIGLSYPQIASCFGISSSEIAKIIAGLKWKHV